MMMPQNMAMEFPIMSMRKMRTGCCDSPDDREYFMNMGMDVFGTAPTLRAINERTEREVPTIDCFNLCLFCPPFTLCCFGVCGCVSLCLNYEEQKRDWAAIVIEESQKFNAAGGNQLHFVMAQGANGMLMGNYTPIKQREEVVAGCCDQCSPATAPRYMLLAKLNPEATEAQRQAAQQALTQMQMAPAQQRMGTTFASAPSDGGAPGPNAFCGKCGAPGHGNAFCAKCGNKL